LVTLVTEAMPKQTAESGGEEQDENQSEPIGATVDWLGAKFTDVTDYSRNTYSLKDVKSGAVGVDVPTGSIASDAGLMEGDVIRAVNRVTINSTSDFKKLPKDIDPKKGLVFDVVRRGRSFYLSYKALQ
jgi:serine protease Do